MKDKIIELIYKTIKGPYQSLFKNNKAWNMTIEEYLENPENTLGRKLGEFLVTNSYAIQPQLEEHDVYHVLTNCGTTVKEEIKMQWYLLGNSKKTPFVFIVISASIFYPIYFNEFMECYKKGKKAISFHHLDFSKMLHIPIQNIKTAFNIT